MISSISLVIWLNTFNNRPSPSTSVARSTFLINIMLNMPYVRRLACLSLITKSMIPRFKKHWLTRYLRLKMMTLEKWKTYLKNDLNSFNPISIRPMKAVLKKQWILTSIVLALINFRIPSICRPLTVYPRWLLQNITTQNWFSALTMKPTTHRIFSSARSSRT